MTILVFTNCKTQYGENTIVVKSPKQNSLFTIAFGSCDNQKIKNELWTAIDKNHPSAYLAGVSICCFLILFFMLPETKGKDLLSDE